MEPQIIGKEQKGIDRSDGGKGFDYYVRFLDNDRNHMNESKHFDSFVEAWEALPACITAPDHFEEREI